MSEIVYKESLLVSELIEILKQGLKEYGDVEIYSQNWPIRSDYVYFDGISFNIDKENPTEVMNILHDMV